MDIESIGGGAGAGGVIATIFAILGINRKPAASAVCAFDYLRTRPII